MTAPEPVRAHAFVGVGAVWVVAVLAGVAVGVLVPAADRPAWLMVALAGCLILSFAVQLARGQATGFIARVAGSVLGAVVILGAASAILAVVGAVSA